MVGTYIESQLREDPEILARRGRVRGGGRGGAVALDLGMLLLQHAQGLSDPERGNASWPRPSRPSYQSSAWPPTAPSTSLARSGLLLGRQGARGTARSSTSSSAHQRDARLLLQIADVLREVGSHAESRTLAEEGYKTAKDVQVKQHCATLRGLLETDLDNRIDWLEKGQSGRPFDRALLSSDRGMKAMQEGDEAAAVRHLREAARLYESLPDDPAKLNNAFGVLRKIASLTGMRMRTNAPPS